MILTNILVNANLDSENPIKINYDKHGRFLGVELYCGGDEVEGTTTTTITTTTTENKTTTPQVTPTTPTTEAPNGCDSCQNEITGKRVYHQECMRFCVCEPDGKVTISDCSFGLIFNYPTQSCVDPILSECPYTQWSR